MDDNGLEREGISDLDLCQMWLLSHNFDVFCNTLGAKMGTAEVARKKFDNLRAENARLTAAHEAAADELARVVQELREAREALWVSEAAKHLAPIMGNAATAYASDLQKIYGKDYSPQEAVEEDQTYWEAKE